MTTLLSPGACLAPVEAPEPIDAGDVPPFFDLSGSTPREAVVYLSTAGGCNRAHFSACVRGRRDQDFHYRCVADSGTRGEIEIERSQRIAPEQVVRCLTDARDFRGDTTTLLTMPHALTIQVTTEPSFPGDPSDAGPTDGTVVDVARAVFVAELRWAVQFVPEDGHCPREDAICVAH